MNKKLLKIALVIGIVILLVGVTVIIGVSARKATLHTTSGASINQYWFDNFDTYAAGSPLHGQGGWVAWDNNAAATGYVTSDQFRSSPNSVEIKWFTTVGADMVHEYSNINSGTWIYKAWQYVPEGMTGTQFFILMNTYTVGVHNNPDWSLQLEISAAGGYIRDFNNVAASLPLKKNQWVEIRVEIDFEADIQTIYYDNTFLTSKSWKNGVAQGGAKNLACVDLYAGDTASTAIYYDDMSVAPEGPPLTCDAGGPYSGNAEEPIQFIGTAAGGIEPYNWLWDFDDGDTSDEQNPTHAYSDPGDYNITLTVTDAIHDTTSDYAIVTISETPKPELQIIKFSGGFGVSATIINMGTANATNIQVNITFTGPVFPKKKTETVTTLTVDEQANLKAIVFGFGKTTITINATCAESSTTEKIKTGTIFIIFVLGVK